MPRDSCYRSLRLRASPGLFRIFSVRARNASSTPLFFPIFLTRRLPTPLRPTPRLPRDLPRRSRFYFRCVESGARPQRRELRRINRGSIRSKRTERAWGFARGAMVMLPVTRNRKSILGKPSRRCFPCDRLTFLREKSICQPGFVKPPREILILHKDLSISRAPGVVRLGLETAGLNISRVFARTVVYYGLERYSGFVRSRGGSAVSDGNGDLTRH